MLSNYPETKKDQKTAVATLLSAFSAAQSERQTREDRWLRAYRLYRSTIDQTADDTDRQKSKLFVPIIFYVVETVAPRLVAQLPIFTVYPVGPEDAQVVDPSGKTAPEMMETALRWATDASELYLQMVIEMKSALLYGTGIMKDYYDVRTAQRPVQTPVMQDIMMPRPVIEPETGEPMVDINGEPMMEEVSIGQMPTGRTRKSTERFTTYAGPVGEAVDIFNFWPAPEASSIDDARYVIHRTVQPREYFDRKVAEGVYRRPPDITDGMFYRNVDDPKFRRYAEVGLSGSANADPTGKFVELLEYWTDDKVLTLANRQSVVRFEPNPFAHGEKPFTRLVDHLDPHAFWGIGEVEVLEGLQDHINALTNQRIDNIRLLLDAMFIVDAESVVDRKELKSRPGGVVRVNNRNGLPLDQVIQRLNFGDVTQSAYIETGEAEAMVEKVSGVSAYQLGTDSPNLNRTATGVTLISEQASTRFAHKLKMMELTGLKKLARHYGLLLQQFLTEPMAMRLLGPGGEMTFAQLTPESIAGRFDFDIEAESSAQTESWRKQQMIDMFGMLAADPFINPIELRRKLLRVGFDEKNPDRYIMMPQPQMGQMGAEMGQGEPVQTTADQMMTG